MPHLITQDIWIHVVLAPLRLNDAKLCQTDLVDEMKSSELF
jgi:hypothetical protein